MFDTVNNMFFVFFLGGYHMLQETMFHSQWGNISINNQ